jgi:CcmD family protein
MKQLLVTLFVLLCMFTVHAQDGTAEAANEGLRAGGKIYVVLAVAVTILVGLIVYVARLDRKITKLERQIK